MSTPTKKNAEQYFEELYEQVINMASLVEDLNEKHDEIKCSNNESTKLFQRIINDKLSITITNAICQIIPYKPTTIDSALDNNGE